MSMWQKLFGAPAPLPEQALVIDVRSPAEYASGHLQGAIPLPLAGLAEGIGRIAPDKSAPLIVYCQSGMRSGAARRQLEASGYRNVVNGGGVASLAERLQRPIVRD